MTQTDDAEEELKVYLEQQEKIFGCRLHYVEGKDMDRYHIVVPEEEAKKAGKEYDLKGIEKNRAHRFSTNETRAMLNKMIVVEQEIGKRLNDMLRRFFEYFSENNKAWKKVVDCVGILDCLASLAMYGVNENQICFPEIVDADGSHPVNYFDFPPTYKVLPRPIHLKRFLQNFLQ